MIQINCQAKEKLLLFHRNVFPQKMLSRMSQSPCYVTRLWINVTCATSVIRMCMSCDTCVTCAMCDMQYMRHVWHAIHVTHVWHAIHVTCVTWHATCVLTDVTQVISIVSTPLCPFHCHNSPQKPQNSVHKRFMSRQMLPTLVWFISLPLFSFKFINLLPALTRLRRRTLLPTLKQYQTSLNKVRQVISFLPDSNK